MGFQIRAYFTFLWRSFHLHGIHSPFIYALDSLCFDDKKHYSFYKKLQVFKNDLLKNDVKFGASSFKKSRLLYRLVNHLKIEKALELGFSDGLETLAIASGNTKSILVVDHQPIPKMIDEYFAQDVTKKIVQSVISPESFLKTLENNATYDLVFFYENTSAASTFSYFEKALPLTHNDTVFVFEQIHASKESEQLWENIQQHHKVQVTVDTFYLGFVFFRKEQTKENFVIRAR